MQAMQFLNQQVPKQRRTWMPGMMPEEGEPQSSFGSHEFICEVGRLLLFMCKSIQTPRNWRQANHLVFWLRVCRGRCMWSLCTCNAVAKTLRQVL